jgi:hypothetical protein
MSAKMIFLTVSLVIAGIVADAGFIGVRVYQKRPDGHNIFLYVPAILVPVAVNVAPQQKLEQAMRKAKEFLPALRIAAEELERMPDGLLVEVKSPREYVHIEKSGGSLVVDVDNERETVHVSVPLRMVRDAARDLEARTRRMEPVEDASAGRVWPK